MKRIKGVSIGMSLSKRKKGEPWEGSYERAKRESYLGWE